uniref:Putative leucine-rich repeat protein (LRRP) n=1 Tax=Trypanosoma congolense (strain IL3000) TaxID=1068625 RepID=G0UYI7_TRYCI|nr:putative leucine-rich repeat protein (LRRP) [Trypanosoma congolense IL3000]
MEGLDSAYEVNGQCTDTNEPPSTAMVGEGDVLINMERWRLWLLQRQNKAKGDLSSSSSHVCKLISERYTNDYTYFLSDLRPCREDIIPKPKRCDVHFPSVTTFDEPLMSTLLHGAANGAEKKSACAPVGAGGVIPLRDLSKPPSNTQSLSGLFRQSGRSLPRLDARVVHPQGFRILKNRSVIERSLRSYFRLPPAPSERLIRERTLSQRLLLMADAKDDEEEARVFDAAMEGKLRPQRMRGDLTPPNMMLDGFLLLCAGGVPEPEEVKGATLQGSNLVGVMSDDMTHFGNLSFLDVSENELRLEQLLLLTGLEVLHLAYNKISSLEGVGAVVQNSLWRSYGNESSLKSGLGSTQPGEGTRNASYESSSIRSAAAYYARERETMVAHPEDVGAFDPIGHEVEVSTGDSSNKGDAFSGFASHGSPVKAFDHINQTVGCSTHDVLLTNLHTLNLSFNRIPSSHILHLSYFPSLEKLDLSGNKLGKLPDDLGFLTSVTHFALERNMFRDSRNVFRALSTMPALIEVNLNHNKLRCVPPISVKDGHGLCFPCIEVVGLGHNCVERAQDVAALCELVCTLSRVILVGNPIAVKRKERGGAQALFAQAVVNRYWRQAGLQDSSRGQEGYSSFSPYGTETVDDTGFSQLHSNMGFHASERHGVDELSKGSRPGKRMQSPMAGFSEQRKREFHDWAQRYDGFDDSGEQTLVSEEGVDGGVPFHNSSREHSQLRTDTTRNRSMYDYSGSGISVSGDICWYGDAPVPPSLDKGGETPSRVLPSLSLLRFVELVFDDVIMPKRNAAQFYGKQKGQRTADKSVSAMVHARTGLVTVPKHEEYMDIRRIVKSHPHSSSKCPYRTGAEKDKSQMAHMVLPMDDDDVEVREEEGAQWKEANERDEEYEEAEEETDSSSDGDASPQDVVFMTGVGLKGKRVKSRKKVEIMESQHEIPKGSDDELQQKTHIPQPPLRANGPGRRRPRVGDSGPAAHLAVKPPGTNARILMNELRRMLRRPLPPLPSACTARLVGSKPNGHY